MITRKAFVLFLAALSLSGCTLLDLLNPRVVTPEEKNNTGNSDTRPKNGEFYGELSTTGDYCGYEFYKDSATKPATGVGEVKIYAFNDFHGAVLESDTEPGLKRMATYYKEKSQEKNTLIFDQGDTWQGSFESNYNYGTLIQDVFNYSNISLRTLGNHDFDWGLEKLEETANKQYEKEYIPSLCSNVYNFSQGSVGTEQQSRYGKEYATFVLDNGLKVGVVGVIGEEQWTSICSTYVHYISFTNPVEKIKELSDYLRSVKQCDIVVASTHESSATMFESASALTEVSPVTHKRYVDLVLGGHSHYDQKYELNGVPFVQWSANGLTNGCVTLKYNFNTNSLIDDELAINTYNANYIKYHYKTIEPHIEEMVDSYLNEIKSIGDEVLSTNFVGEFDTSALARLVSEAIYKRVQATFTNLRFAISNYARNSFSGSTFTYRDLYHCFPFDNEIVILQVHTNYGISSISYNFSYREDTELTPTYGGDYRCAIVDYVALHKNSNRELDKFPECTTYAVFSDDERIRPNYREILYDYLKSNKDKVFDASNYQVDNPHFLN